jgi:hypothetical protein
MMRVGLLLALGGVCEGRCQGEQCPSLQDTSNLIQRPSLVQQRTSDADSSEDPSGWTFENSFFDNLLDKLSPDAITDKIDNIIEDSSLSLQFAQEKLSDLANKFGTRLNETMEAAQDRISSLQKILSEKGRKVKDQSLIQAVTMITNLGDAAVDVAQKVTAEVEEGQLKVRQMVTLLKSETVESRRQELQLSLDVTVTTLTGLVHALQDAMRRTDNDDDADLMQLDASAASNASEPDLTRAAIEKAEKLLQRTDKLLDNAKVYIEFVQTRVDSVREEATRLVEAADNQTEAAFDLSDKVAEDVIKKLGEIDSMLTGTISVVDAKVVMSHHSASPRAALSLFAGLSAVLVANC